MAKHQFQTEVGQLLELITHSLYSHKEIFLRELVSNASDALDKLKYLTLTELKDLDFDPSITIEFTEGDNALIRVMDNGIGMNEADLSEHLGTIAKSGTKAFFKQLTGDHKKDSNLIGQFGVGFYSSFMVADSIDIYSRKQGEVTVYKWSSDGKGEFSIEEATSTNPEASKLQEQGTSIILHLNENGKEFASQWRIQDLIKKYSNHIAFPIILNYEKTNYDDKGKETGKEPVSEQANSASALWKRNKNDISEDEYKEFYKNISHDFEEPLFWIHTQAEGSLEYSTLYYIPQKAPMDMNYPDYKPGVKLYVRRVFITDDDKELLPVFLRFLRGVIDSEDLPLNVSREILQQNKIMTNIRSASVKKILGEFKRLAVEDPEKYNAFIEQYNRPLKEGLYSEFSYKEDLMELVRYKSTRAEGYTSLSAYKDRMLPDQKSMYYITGDKEQTLRHSPLLEAYKKRDIEVLIMDDDIDEIVAPGLQKYKDIEFKAVNRSDAGKDLNEKSDKKKEKAAKPVIEKIKNALGDRVKEVKVSVRLADSPSCIVVDENDPTFQMQSMMKSMGRGMEMPEVKPILEINPDHDIVKKLGSTEDSALVQDISSLLLEQALLVEGITLSDPIHFVQSLNRVMAEALPGAGTGTDASAGTATAADTD